MLVYDAVAKDKLILTSHLSCTVTSITLEVVIAAWHGNGYILQIKVV